MSDWAWLAIIVIVLVFVAGFLIWLWRNGEGSNGLKGEFGERVTNLENDMVKVWEELKRQANRWVP